MMIKKPLSAPKGRSNELQIFKRNENIVLQVLSTILPIGNHYTSARSIELQPKDIDFLIENLQKFKKLMALI